MKITDLSTPVIHIYSNVELNKCIDVLLKNNEKVDISRENHCTFIYKTDNGTWVSNEKYKFNQSTRQLYVGYSVNDLIEYFTMKNTILIPRNALAKIYESVCKEWRDKIKQTIDSYPFEDVIPFPIDLVKETYRDVRDTGHRVWL